METPPIRILQRPCQIAVKNSSEVLRPPAAQKSLEQREADYAAARRRIMGSDAPENESNESGSPTADRNGVTAVDAIETTVPRPGSAVTNSTVTTTATPLMSIQATPSSANGFKSSEFRFQIGTSAYLTNGQPRNVAYSGRQGSNTSCVSKPQQQLQSTLNGTRAAPQQSHRMLTASNSSPSLFTQSSRIAHPIPLFPTQVSGTPNAGLLPTPPGFNYPAQNANTIDSGIGLHHSQSAAFSLMQQFGLLQQQYQQPLNGIHRLISPFSHTNASLNPMNFAVTPLSTTNQKHAHPSTFN